MNHSIPGVNAGYITRHKLPEDHLRRQQQAISSAVFAALGTPPTEIEFFGRGSAEVSPGEQFSALRSKPNPTESTSLFERRRGKSENEI
jgi:hypothetical protein